MPDLTKLPYPIASLLQDMEREQNPVFKFRALIKAFGGFLKYIGLLAASDYLHRWQPEVFQDRYLDELLISQKLARPSLGNWNEFLRETIRALDRMGYAPMITGLKEFYFKPGEKLKPTKYVKYIETFITLRNEYVHPDIFPSEDLSSQLYSMYQPYLMELIEGAEFLHKYPLKKCEGNKILLCIGPEFANFESHQTKAQPYAREFFLDTPQGVIPLLTFLLYGRPEFPPDVKHDDIMLYEGQTLKKIKYLRGNFVTYQERGRFTKTSELLTEIKDQIGINKEHGYKQFVKSNTKAPDWERLFEYCRNSSNSIIQFHFKEGKYHHSLYLSRPTLESHFKYFVQGSEQFAVFVGDSGSGKTNLFCHMTEKLLDQGHCVMHFYGRNFLGGSFENVIAQELVVNKEDLMPYLRAIQQKSEVVKGKRLIIFVDAINEYSHPEILFQSLMNIANSFKAEGLFFCKIVLSSRSAPWSQIEHKFDLPKNLFYYATDADRNKVPYVPIGRLSIEEARQIFNLYRTANQGNREHFNFNLNTAFDDLPPSVKSLATNPILLRMMVSSFTEITQDLTANDILHKYYELKTEQRHRYFLHYFVQALWEKKSDYLVSIQKSRILGCVNMVPGGSAAAPQQI